MFDNLVKVHFCTNFLSFIFQKVERRRKAIERKDLTEDRKRTVRKVMIPELMSSEDEEYDSDDQKYYVIRPLPWLSERIGIIKNDLDLLYFTEMETKKGKDQRKKRVQGQPSLRPRPDIMNTRYNWAFTPE